MNNEFKTWFSDLDLDINELNMCPAIDLFNKYNDYAIENGFEKLDKQRNLVDKMKAIHKYKYDRLKMLEGKRGVFIGFAFKQIKKETKETNKEELLIYDSSSDLVSDSDSDSD